MGGITNSTYADRSGTQRREALKCPGRAPVDASHLDTAAAWNDSRGFWSDEENPPVVTGST